MRVDTNIDKNTSVNSKIKSFDKLFRHVLNHGIDFPTNILTDITEQLTNVQKITTSLQKSLLLPAEERFPGRSLFPRVSPDQDIILAGSIGLAGTILMARYYRDELKTRLPAWMIDDVAVLNEQLSLYPDHSLLDRFDISAAYPVGEAGLRKVLYQLGKDTLKGYRIDPYRVPIHQITIEFCEFYDIDPWRLLSCGCTLLITPRGNALMRELQTLKIPVAIIGYTTGDKDKLLEYGDVQSRVNRPEPDGLLSLLLRDFFID